MSAQPWKSEPDFKRWHDAATGYQCAIIRNHMGALCGYVRIPRRHRLHGAHYFDNAALSLRVHGGVTFAGRIARQRGGYLRGFWLGFDCCHGFDYLPVLATKYNAPSFTSGEYRDWAYVTQQTEALAVQIRNADRKTRG